MGNQALIQEVVSHLSQRFVPSISSIKKVRFPENLVLLNALTTMPFAGDRQPAGEGIHKARGRVDGYI